MGTSVGCFPKSIDPSAGGLVWVRRGNGSWWPGQILGHEELLKSSMASPKAGTPVKLLGRDDTSVDWYNLETSKKVKAFRCGEYDKCIEKAKAVAANNSKKAVKHTRREDAILCALELETASLAKDEHDENINKTVNDSGDCSGSNPDSSEGGGASSFSGEANTSRQPHKTLPSNSNGGSGKATGGAKRKRGLVDLGTGVVQSLKRKRSQVAHVHEFLKKKSRRRRRLMKVLENSSMVTVPVVCEEGLPCPNASLEAPKLPENGGLESLFDVPFVAEEKNFSGLPLSGSLAQNGAEETGAQIRVKTENETSKWLSKGKRNSRRQKAKTFDSQKPQCLSKGPNESSSLYEVNLEVKSSYGRPQHVPYISLTSKINGCRAITGHPLTVETLDDGYCSQLLLLTNASHDFSLEAENRTKKMKPRKPALLSSSKKMRKLSSLTGFRKKVQKKKPAKHPPGLACVSLKVVFGRINEALL